MITAQDTVSIKKTVEEAKTAFVLLGSNPSYDAVASALSLYLSLKNAGKHVQVACPDDMRVEFSYLVGVDEIAKKIGNQNLVVSFQYAEENVEKVSYNISEDGKTFNLTISPKAGGKPLDPGSINFSYAGAAGDIVFIVGSTSFEQLGELYESEKVLYDKAMTVSITPYEITPFAKTSLNTSNQSSLAEGMTALLSELGMEPKDDIATNLLSAIEFATNRFQSVAVNPDTFETVAKLLRNGARRSATNPALQGASVTPAPTSAFAQAMKARSMAPQGQQDIFKVEQLNKKEPPKEWTAPKIFTGSSRV